MDDVEGGAGTRRLVVGRTERLERGLRPVDADHDPTTVTRRGALVADDEDGAAGVRHDLHRHGADPGAAEHPVAPRADDDEGGRARRVDEGLAREPVAHEGRHREGGVDRVGTRDAVGEEPVRVGVDLAAVGAPTEAEHRQVGGEGVEDDEVEPARPGDAGGMADGRHGER